MSEEVKMWTLTVAIVIAVFAINLTLQVTEAKASDFVKSYLNQNETIVEMTYANTRDQMLICTHNPKLPSCPISKVLPKPKASPK